LAELKVISLFKLILDLTLYTEITLLSFAERIIASFIILVQDKSIFAAKTVAIGDIMGGTKF
jgi:hypothetical protein